MDRKRILTELRGLTDKQFVEFFYAAAAGRDIYDAEPDTRSRLVLAAAVQDRDGTSWGTPQVQLLALPDPELSSGPWVDDALICQFGESCAHEVASWAKEMRCPACGESVYGT